MIFTNFSLFSNLSSALNSTGNGTSSEEEEAVGHHADRHHADHHSNNDQYVGDQYFGGDDRNLV